MDRMLDFDFTLLIQLANFLITIVVLNFLLIKPVREQIAVRSLLLSNYAADIEKFNAQAADKLNAYEASLSETRAKATLAREAVKADAQAQEQALLQTAHSEAQTYLQTARGQIAADSKAAMNTLNSQVNDYAAQALAKILG